MYQLPDPAIEAILKEWSPEEYDPPNTDIQAWSRSIETLCDTYGIPDTQRALCATRFIKNELRVELEKVLREARVQFGPVHWAQFANFMVAFDRKFREACERRLSQYAGVALGIVGGLMLAPVAIAGALTAVGFTSAGVAAGSVAAFIQSTVYGSMTGGIFSLLQSAGATMVLPSAGTIFTGAATTGTGIAMMNGESVDASEFLNDSISRGHRPVGPGDDGPPPYRRVVPRKYRLTRPAINAIVKSWELQVAPYNPPETDVSDWLDEIRRLSEEYDIPVGQQALCASHLMRNDCGANARTAGCDNMTWDQFATWLIRYDGGYWIIRHFRRLRLQTSVLVQDTIRLLSIGLCSHAAFGILLSLTFTLLSSVLLSQLRSTSP